MRKGYIRRLSTSESRTTECLPHRHFCSRFTDRVKHSQQHISLQHSQLTITYTMISPSTSACLILSLLPLLQAAPAPAISLLERAPTTSPLKDTHALFARAGNPTCAASPIDVRSNEFWHLYWDIRELSINYTLPYQQCKEISCKSVKSKVCGTNPDPSKPAKISAYEWAQCYQAIGEGCYSPAPAGQGKGGSMGTSTNGRVYALHV